MAKMNMDLTIPSQIITRHDSWVRGSLHEKLQEARNKAQEQANKHGKPFIVYHSRFRRQSSQYRVVSGSEHYWRGERGVYVVGPEKNAD